MYPLDFSGAAQTRLYQPDRSAYEQRLADTGTIGPLLSFERNIYSDLEGNIQVF